MDKVWTAHRNEVFTWQSNVIVMWWKYLVRMKEILVSAGWTLLGTGTGTSGTYNFDGTDILPTFPSTTGMGTYAWICLRAPDNGDGRPRPEIVIQQYHTTADSRMFWRPEGGYTSAGISATSRPTAGLGSENAHPSGTDKDWPISGVTSYWNIFTAPDGSFMSYNYSSSRGAAWHFFLRCMNVQDNDPYPYVSFWRSSSGYQMVDSWQIGYQNGNPSIASYHPTYGKIWSDEAGGGTDKGHGGSRMGLNTSTLWRGSVSPVDGSIQMIGVWVMSWGTTKGHLKGRLPDVFECYSANNTKVNNGEYVQLGSYMLPWLSDTDNLTQ